jgi:hypothetical protein
MLSPSVCFSISTLYAMPSYVLCVSDKSRGLRLVAERANGLASIFRAMLSGRNSSSGIGPMIPRWLRVGVRKTGIAPVIVIACRIDTWQLRSTTTTSLGATFACHTILFDVDVPLVTK